MKKSGSNEKDLKNVLGILSGPFVSMLNEDFNQIAPKCFFFWENESKSNAMSEVLRNIFLPQKNISRESYAGFNNLLSDGLIGYPIHKFVELTWNFTDVFYYLMKSELKISIINLSSNFTSQLKVIATPRTLLFFRLNRVISETAYSFF